MMRRFVLAIVALLSLTSAVHAQFAIFQTYAGPPQIFYNIVTDGGAVCDGVTDTAPAFKTFNIWARANQGASNQVVLTIPAGADCFFGTSQTITGTTLLNAWAAGINNLIVEGTGATLNSVGGAGFSLGGQGIIQRGLASASGQSARIQSATAGATQVTLTAASLSAGYVSRFSAGKVIMLGGLDIQGLWNTPYGFPPNNQFFEWRTVTAVDGGTGVITLDRALTNTYLDTWPNYNAGNDFEVDQGGPATIFALNDTWNISVEYRGLTINQDGQTYAGARNVTYRNVTFGGAHGGIPTQNETWSAINSNMAGMNMEVDKLIGTMTMDTVTVDHIKFQSSSVDLFVGRNLTVTTDISGSPKNVDLSDSTIAAWNPGAYAYGATTGYTKCTRCNVAAFALLGGVAQNTPADFSMSSGVISFPNTSVTGSGPPSRIWVPSGNVFWNTTGYTTAGLIQGGAITQDATDVHVQTSEVGGFPSLISASPQFRTHLAPQFTCDDCSGDPKIVAVNIQRGATPLAPLGVYGSRDFAPTGTFKNTSQMQMVGRLVSLSVNVTQPYTGTGAAILNPTAEFFLTTVKQSDWTTENFWPTINLKVAGNRVITPSGVTCNGSPGACSGDTITAPSEAVWLPNGINPSLPSSLSGGGTLPLFTIILQTDQGVVP